MTVSVPPDDPTGAPSAGLAGAPAPAMLQGTASSLDEALLARLLAELGAEAQAFRFEVAPNPCVGAAILAAGQVVARGHHELWGGPHAEVVALERATQSGRPAAEWDVLVVTLEPCSSSDKTGPCVETILASGLRRVVVGALDPDPRHRGRGIERLREAGVEVYLMEGHVPLESVAPHFLHWNKPERLRRPRPWTIAKWAQTRTGQLTPPEDVGEGRWISGPESLAEVQVLRGRVDAILTGIGTVTADDPRLSVRAPGDVGSPPLRAVLDSTLTMGSETYGGRMLAPLDTVEAAAGREAAGQVLVYCLPGPKAERHRALSEVGAEVVTIPGDDEGLLSLWAALEDLWERGCRRVLLEAGPTLIQAFHEAGLLDQVRIYSGDVSSGRGPSLASLVETLVTAHFGRDAEVARLDRESGADVVLELFR